MPPHPLSNYRLTICYDGTDYHGWQRQPQKKTIQGTIEQALSRIAGTEVPVFGSGRTDAGVHARGQTAHFTGAFRLPAPELMTALNGNLPRDIRALTLEKAPPDFHARKSAVGKIYRYRIANSVSLDPFQIRYVLHIPFALDVRSMRKAAALFVREADFTPFSSNRERHPVRRIVRSEIEKIGTEIVYTVEANGFLRYMVRSMVGTLLQIGRGRYSPEEIERFFRQGKRTPEIPTAPPQGLCLMTVKYGPEYGLPPESRGCPEA